MVTELNADIAVGLTQAIQQTGDYDWHDVGTVITLLGRDDTLDHFVRADGSVNETGLQSALVNLARDKPWLLVDPYETAQVVSATVSGGNVGTGRHRFDDHTVSEAYLRKKYPALRR